MRKVLTAAAAVALIGASSYADLQNVEVGGGIRIRSNAYNDIAGTGLHTDTAANNEYTEQRTNINLKADFSDEVSTFIELDNKSDWGHSFRDIGGGDTQGTGDEDSNVQLYQAYIDMADAWGTGLDIRVGRQEVQLGSEFLVGNNDTAGGFNGLSFDGVRVDYATDSFGLTVLNLKLDEGDIGQPTTDGDTDLRGVYGSYTGIENLTIDGYYLAHRVGISPGDADELNTFGVRVAGNAAGFDYEVEIAQQDGDAESISATADYEGMAINAEVGYTIDSDLQPRIFAGYASLEGTDGDDIGFNRLFSDWEYSEFLGNTDISNMNIMRLGASIQATEKIGLSLVASSFELDEDGGGEDEVGDEIGLYMTYAYSEDVAVEVGYATFLNGDLAEDNNAPDDEDPTYLYAEIAISF